MSKYIPRGDSAFCDWAHKIMVYAAAHHERWGVMAIDEEVTERLHDLIVKVETCKQPTHSKVDTLANHS